MNRSPFRFGLAFALTCASLLATGATGAPADVAAAVAAVAGYEPGQSAEPLARVEALVRSAVNRPELKAELETGLIRLLASETSLEVKRFACRQLGILGGPAALPALAALLRADDTAGLACFALSTYPPGRADVVLRTALHQATGLARIQIIQTLGNRRDRGALGALTELARGSDPAVARAAILAIGRIASPSAGRLLAALRKQATPELQSAVLEASLQLAGQREGAGDRQAATIYEELLAPSQPAWIRRAAFAGLLRLDRDGGSKRILATLRGADETLKPVAIAAIRRLPARSASATFGDLLPTLEPQVQVWLIESLAARGDEAARSAIAKALKTSADSAVRQAAAQALGRIGDARSVPVLAEALTAARAEADAQVIEGALAALPDSPATDRALLAGLNSLTGAARARFIASLAGRRTARVLDAVFAETEHPDAAVAKAAYRVAARATTAETLPKVLARFAAIRDAARRAEVETLVEQAVLNVDEPAARSAAVRAALAAATDLEVKMALLRLLPACGDAAALAALASARADANPVVRQTALEALAEWPDDAAWEALAAVYRAPENDAQHALSLRSLTRLISEGARPGQVQLERYRLLLAGARGDADLKLILGAMGSSTSPDVLRLALPFLNQASVRAEAMAAVRRMAAAIKASDPALAKEALDKIESGGAR